MDKESFVPSLRELESPPLLFCSQNIALRVTFSATVVSHFARYRQSSRKNTEAGGQLFARFSRNTIDIIRATGPRRGDRRSIFSFLPDRLAERREIKQLFKEGLHYVGDWHTHPQKQPAPSSTDIGSFRDMFQRSRHELQYFVMAIVGTRIGGSGLFVALVNDKISHTLTCVEQT